MPFVMRNCRPVSGHSNAPSTISTSIKTWCKFFKNSSSSPDLWFSVNSLGSVLASPSYRFCGRKMEIFIKQILVFLQLKQKKKLEIVKYCESHWMRRRLTAVAPWMIVGHSNRGMILIMNSGLNSFSTSFCWSIYRNHTKQTQRH